MLLSTSANLNQVASWCEKRHPETQESQGCLRRHVCTRLSNVVINAPVSLFYSGAHLIKATYQGVTLPLKAFGHVISYVPRLSCLAPTETLMTSVKEFFIAFLQRG